MRTLKWTLIALLLLTIGGFLHYTLPRHDIVRVVETETRRVEFSSWNTVFFSDAEPISPTQGNRDVRFISTVGPNDGSRVYRNEDTGWGWPPYFKFNSSDVQAQASALINPGDAVQWVQITKYGWRNQFISIYPNVLRVKPVDSPGVTIIPWFNIIFLIAALTLITLIWRAIARFRRNRIDPIVADVSEAFERVDDKFDQHRAKARTRRQRLREWWIETFG